MPSSAAPPPVHDVSVSPASRPSESPLPDWVLHPAVRVLWRHPSCVQLELSDRAIVVEGVDTPTVARLVGRAGPRGGRPLPAPAAAALAKLGFLRPRRMIDDPHQTPPRPRLGAELTGMSARFGDRAAEVLASRRYAAVAVHGTGRAAVHLAAVLAAAGVGRVRLGDRGSIRLHQAQPGGLQPDDEGQPFEQAATEALVRAAPEVDPSPLPTDECPDLVVLAIDEPVDPERRASLAAHGWAHLAVATGIDQGVIGPLVIPGLTSCLNCVDAHRRDRDAAWPALAVQLAIPRRGPTGCDVALSTVVAGVAALQVLAFLDGEQPATIGGTIELHPPDWRMRRRSWPTHPSCGCQEPGLGGEGPRRPAPRPGAAREHPAGHNGTR